MEATLESVEMYGIMVGAINGKKNVHDIMYWYATGVRVTYTIIGKECIHDYLLEVLTNSNLSDMHSCPCLFLSY